MDNLSLLEDIRLASLSYNYRKERKKIVNEVPNEIFKKWHHSFEEDKDDIIVYRPEKFNFPPARGRSGIEFKPNGTFIQTSIGSTDANQSLKGQWKMKNSHNLHVAVDGNKQNLEIIEYKDDILRVRERSAAISSEEG